MYQPLAQKEVIAAQAKKIYELEQALATVKSRGRGGGSQPRWTTYQEDKSTTDRFLACTLAFCALAAVLLLSDHSSLTALRTLSINLGGGKCLWTQAQPLPAQAEIPRTLLVSYPGSGKRYVWRAIEGLTGYRVGDDWDHSEFGKHVATLKTSYPHPESDWVDGRSAWEPWVDEFGDAAVVYIVRSPRDAITNYHNMKQELAHAITWDGAHSKVGATYTYQSRLAGWLVWRDDNKSDLYPLDDRERATIEIEEWGKNIDFWMNGGTSDPEKGVLCQSITNCRPTVVLSFEKLFSPDVLVSEAEFDRMTTAMERPGLPIIEPEARVCVIRETKRKKKWANQWDDRSRFGKGNDDDEKPFSSTHLNQMIVEIQRLLNVYTQAPWVADPNAQVLVESLNQYKADITEEWLALGGGGGEATQRL